MRQNVIVNNIMKKNNIGILVTQYIFFITYLPKVSICLFERFYSFSLNCHYVYKIFYDLYLLLLQYNLICS